MIAVCFGRRGSGKTTWIKNRIETFSRVCIFDPMAEYSDVAEVYDLDSFLDKILERDRGLFRLALDPADEQISLTFEAFCRACWITGDLLMVIDETSLVSSAVSIPPAFAKVIRQGRHRGLSILAASQRAAEVPRMLTSQSDELVSFSQTEPNDINYLKRFVDQGFAADAQRLDRYEFVTFMPFPDSPERQSVIE